MTATRPPIDGYSAHADQNDLMEFIKGVPQAPSEIRLIHGDLTALEVLKEKIKAWAEDTGHTLAVTQAE